MHVDARLHTCSDKIFGIVIALNKKGFNTIPCLVFENTSRQKTNGKNNKKQSKHNMFPTFVWET